MGDLPDLNTSNVGYIAYWNIGSDGSINLDNFGPEDCLSAADLISYTTYDNGFEGEIKIGTNEPSASWPRPRAKVRVKTDGWFICYVDRTNTFIRDEKWDGSGELDCYEGYWRIHDSWIVTQFNGGGVQPISQDAFATAINHLQSETGLATTWNFSDVGLYNYEYSGATNTTGMNGDGNAEGSPDLVVAPGTDVKWSAVTGACDKDGGNDEVYWEGKLVASETESEPYVPGAGSYDPGTLTEGTEYGHGVANGYDREVYTATFLWS